MSFWDALASKDYKWDDKLAALINRIPLAEVPLRIGKNRTFRGHKIGTEWRSSRNAWGRFGGGWDFKVGFQVGGSTTIFELGFLSLRWERPEKVTR